MYKNLKKIMALFMVCIMMSASIPATSFAADENKNIISVEDRYIFDAGKNGTAEGYLHDIAVSGAAVSIYNLRGRCCTEFRQKNKCRRGHPG